MDHTLDRRSFVCLTACAVLFSSLSRAGEAEEPPAAFGPVPASEITEADELFLRRPVIVFADSPNDPNFIRQMEILPTLYAQLALRDVVLITDTDPANPSEIRKKLRPRGFSLVMMDKDWRSPIRRPSPRAAREIINTIDKMPIARTEALEKNPAGR
ncbi:hypothetical protein XINFAN_03424 [Pseudogemmobacter humi]|uniref:DUF4174 domain-containing protein n=2 Tax=Pseudogemmobacter humi TaxID=2483812 RepID=A0A3P5XX16_9RHOB|nr:hypothetical protein XINFAN_03424 [Pseudogemmobacter humi]